MKSIGTKILFLFAALTAPTFGASVAFGNDTDSRCEAKDRAACVEAAEVHLNAADLSMATVMLKKACFLKHKSSCLKLAEISLQANNTGIAREALEEGCRYESKWACDELTKMDQKNKVLNKDDAGKAMLVWSLACTKGSATGCRKQGEAEFELGQKDASRASYLRGCSLGDKPSCAQVSSAPAH